MFRRPELFTVGRGGGSQTHRIARTKDLGRDRIGAERFGVGLKRLIGELQHDLKSHAA